MNENPKFEVVKRTPYGPELRRVNPESDFSAIEDSDIGYGPKLVRKGKENFNLEAESEELYPEFIEPTDEQRENLRNVLSDIGIDVLPKKKRRQPRNRDNENIDHSRRGFLKVMGAGAVAVGAAAVGHNILSEIGKEKTLTDSGSGEETSYVAESVEKAESLATFENEIEGYKAFTKLRKDEVLFVDEYNRPVGTPVVLEEFSGELPPGVEAKPGHAPIYNYLLGRKDEIGLPVDKIPPRWLGYKQRELQVSHPDQKIVRQINVVPDFQAAYNETDEPELVSAIARGEIDSYDKIVSHFAEKPVRGHEKLNRMAYAQEKIQFRSEYDESKNRPAVPVEIQKELRRLLPGWFAQESKFNAGLVSKSEAAGLAQIKPNVWREYRGTEKVSLRMDEQIDVVGELVSDNYHYILYYAGSAIDVLRNQYDSEKEFYTDLMVPLLVNAYNAGGPMMGKAVKSFVENVSPNKMRKGKELFLQIADYAVTNSEDVLADYIDEAREYVPRVYANTGMLEEKYS